MSNSTWISALVALIALIMPFIIIRLVRNRRLENFRAYFKTVSNKYKLKIDESDTWNDRMAGIDFVGEKFLFCKLEPTGERTETVVDLKYCRRCDKQIDYLTGGQQVRDLFLVFYMNDGAEERFNFYDCTTDYTVSNEMQLLNKYHTKIGETCGPDLIILRTLLLRSSVLTAEFFKHGNYHREYFADRVRTAVDQHRGG